MTIKLKKKIYKSGNSWHITLPKWWLDNINKNGTMPESLNLEIQDDNTLIVKG